MQEEESFDRLPGGRGAARAASFLDWQRSRLQNFVLTHDPRTLSYYCIDRSSAHFGSTILFSIAIRLVVAY
jgi:hypothetical protein